MNHTPQTPGAEPAAARNLSIEVPDLDIARVISAKPDGWTLRDATADERFMLRLRFAAGRELTVDDLADPRLRDLATFHPDRPRFTPSAIATPPQRCRCRSLTPAEVRRIAKREAGRVAEQLRDEIAEALARPRGGRHV